MGESSPIRSKLGPNPTLILKTLTTSTNWRKRNRPIKIDCNRTRYDQLEPLEQGNKEEKALQTNHHAGFQLLGLLEKLTIKLQQSGFSRMPPQCDTRQHS